MLLITICNIVGFAGVALLLIWTQPKYFTKQRLKLAGILVIGGFGATVILYTIEYIQ